MAEFAFVQIRRVDALPSSRKTRYRRRSKGSKKFITKLRGGHNLQAFIKFYACLLRYFVLRLDSFYLNICLFLYLFFLYIDSIKSEVSEVSEGPPLRIYSFRLLRLPMAAK